MPLLSKGEEIDKGRNFKNKKRFPSMPKGENVGHGVMVLALMSKRAKMINVDYGIDVKRSIWNYHYMSLRS